MTQSIDVLGYQVIVGGGSLNSLGAVCRRVAPAYRYAIISDDQVAQHWLAPAIASIAAAAPDASVTSVAIPAGEGSKTRDSWSQLTDWLLSQGAGRDSAIVALGGGVVGDLAGFVAATYMRGIPVIQVPTSLLAMVDASIGGKTGVDTEHGKNLVGAFHQPAAVVIDPATLGTLPAAHLRAGIAEVIKHGAISNVGYFRAAAAWAASAQSRSNDFAWNGSDTIDVIARSVKTKADVVNADPHEKGRRQVLNAGHTVAHALERETNYTLLHGEAVAIGLVIEAELGEAASMTTSGTASALAEALGGAGLPISMPAGLNADRLVAAMRVDKKSRGGGLAFSLLKAIGTPAGSDSTGWSAQLDEQLVREVLARKAR